MLEFLYLNIGVFPKYFHWIQWQKYLLPAATKLWPRLCFYTCLWFCSWGGLRRTPPDQGEPPWTRQTPPRHQGDPPPRQGEPPRTRQTPRTKENPPRPDRPPRPGRPPGRRLQYTVNERPVRILLECILVIKTVQTCHLLCERPECYHSASKTHVRDSIFKFSPIHASVIYHSLNSLNSMQSSALLRKNSKWSMGFNHQ